MKITISLLSLFISTATLKAMDRDAMEVDNGSPRENEHVKAVVFRAIDTRSPIATTQKLDNANDAARSTSRAQSCSQLLVCSTPCREMDRIEVDLGELAIDPNAMDMDDK